MAVHFVVSVAVAAAFGVLPWAIVRLGTRPAATGAAIALAVMVAGAISGLPLYPVSDLIVFAFTVLAGVVLGRAMPPRFRPLLVLLLVLSALDVAQNATFAGPAPGAPSFTGSPDPHIIWLNFRFPLPGGHFNIGFADLLLIAAVSEHLRRRGAPLPLASLPGVLGLGLADAVAATLPQAPPALLSALSTSLIPFLTAGYALTELAVSQTKPPQAPSVTRPDS